MFITHPEYDFWPWSWKNQNKSCSSLNDYEKAWKTIDWLNDKTFDPRANKLKNDTGDLKNRIVAKGITCQTHDVDISEKITLSDYQDYAVKKFDQQMEKIVNKNKVALGLSGGIDSMMCFSWLYKNKVDFETFTWQRDAWKSTLNSVTENNARKICRATGVKHTIVDYDTTKIDKHDLIKNYCMAQDYMFPQQHLMSQGDNWNSVWQEMFDDKIRLAPIGTDDLFLHKKSSWQRFIPKKMTFILDKVMKEPACLVFNYGYKVGGFSREYLKNYKWQDGYQMMGGWDDILFYFMLTGTMVSPATSREWYEMWHRIDEDSCNNQQLRDMIDVGWLKRQVANWLGGDELVPLIRSAPCYEQLYVPNKENRKYILHECLKIAKLYQKSTRVELYLWWLSAIEMIKTFDQVTPQIVESIHTINWLLNHQKNLTI